MSSRAYVSPLRTAEAAATRARIVEAATELFVRDGYAATPMRAIASKAGVSLPTVHLHGPKHALLLAGFEIAFAGSEGRQSLAERPAMAEIVAEPRDDIAIDRYVRFVAAANARAAPIMRALAAAASADAGARAAAEDLDRRRRRDMQLAADLLAERGLLARDRVQHAADVLGYLTGADAYVHLVGACGWPLDAYEHWLRDGIEHLLDAPSARAAPDEG